LFGCLAVDQLIKLWHNPGILNKKALMETSMSGFSWQRTWTWCKPGQLTGQKILPELQSETN
jgi:hypothetical protein